MRELWNLLMLAGILLVGCGNQASTPTSFVGNWTGQLTDKELGTKTDCQLTVNADGTGQYTLKGSAASDLTWTHAANIYTLTGVRTLSAFSATGTITGNTFSGTAIFGRDLVHSFVFTKSAP